MKNLILSTFLVLACLYSNSASSETVYVHSDILGSPIMETNSSGTVTSRSHYKPFGEALEGMKKGVGYTGHLNDKDLELTYMQARYYDPVIGRFYSNDPVGFTNIHTFNRYAYANNNPYKYTDPNGQSALVLEGIKDGVIIGGSSGGPWGAVAGGIIGALIGASATYGIIQLASDSTDLPTDLVGDQSDDRAGKSRGKRHNSGPLTSENGGTGNPEEDFDTLTGGTGKPAEGRKEGTIIGENGVTIRPGKEGEGPRIDIPANGEKPPETLHYDQ